MRERESRSCCITTGLKSRRKTLSQLSHTQLSERSLRWSERARPASQRHLLDHYRIPPLQNLLGMPKAAKEDMKNSAYPLQVSQLIWQHIKLGLMSTTNISLQAHIS